MSSAIRIYTQRLTLQTTLNTC